MHEGSKYRYVMSIIDIFSRYVWLRGLTSKRSAEVAHNMKDIYMEQGSPRVLQHDQGGEHKRTVIRLMERLHVRIISSSPYHPQSQGKVERAHRSFRDKLQYDLA